MKQKLLEMVQVTVLFHTDEFIYVWSFNIDVDGSYYVLLNTDFYKHIIGH